MNYSEFHKNRVRYNINTNNITRSEICIIQILNKIDTYLVKLYY